MNRAPFLAPQPPRGGGFTLVELLVALSLSAVVLTLVFTGYAVVLAVRRGQAERAAPAETAQQALRQLSRDLERIFVYPGDDATRVLLQADAGAPHGLRELSFCRCALPPGARDPLWATAERVAYRLEAATATDSVLICESRPLAGVGARDPPQTNGLFRHVTRFEVRLFDGKEWQAAWPVGANTSAVPRAARLDLTVQQGPARVSAVTEVYIPVGNRIARPPATGAH